MYKTLDNILTQLEDNKALDIISIDLKGKSDIANIGFCFISILIMF